MASPFYEIDPPGMSVAVVYTIYLLAFKHNFFGTLSTGRENHLLGSMVTVIFMWVFDLRVVRTSLSNRRANLDSSHYTYGVNQKHKVYQ